VLTERRPQWGQRIAVRFLRGPLAPSFAVAGLRQPESSRPAPDV